jgi:predicted dehydrogenase
VAPLQIGLVGVGRWGALVLRDLLALDVEVVAVARSAATRTAAVAAGARAAHHDLGSLAGVDGIVVATTTASHGDVVEACLGHDVPVFCEKPLGTDPVQVRRLAAAAPERLFVMDKWRYHPGIEALGEIARSGELGEVVGLRTVRRGWGNPHEIDDVWVLAPHDLSIALEVLGHVPEPRAAAGWADQSLATLFAILGDRPWCTLDLGGTDIGRRRHVELVTEAGVAWLADGWDEHIGVARRDQVGSDAWERRATPGELPLVAELRAFTRHLRGGPPPRTSAADAVVVVDAIVRLRELAGLAPR